jgi:hypothetical protein
LHSPITKKEKAKMKAILIYLDDLELDALDALRADFAKRAHLALYRDNFNAIVVAIKDRRTDSN